MKKSELSQNIHKLYPFLTLDQVTNLINLTFVELTKALALGKRIEIRGFGSFSTKKRKVQLNFPKSKEEKISFTERNSVHFKIGKEFFDHLNNEH